MKFKTSIEYIGDIALHKTSLVNKPSNKAILLFPEAFGLTGHIKDVSCRFAALGLNVYVFPLYTQVNKNPLFFIEPHNKQLRQEMLDSIDMNYYKNLFTQMQPYFSKYENLLSIGFSVGAYFSILSNKYLKYHNVICFYPNPTINNKNHPNFESLSTYLTELPQAMLFFGQSDYSIPQSEVELFKHEKTKVVVLKDCQHGFFCNSRHTYDKHASSLCFNLIKEFIK
jgi:dienelactone hydrolase